MDATGFTNTVIEEDTLPKAEDLIFEGLADSYARSMIIESLSVLAIIFIISFVVSNLKEEIGVLVNHWWFYSAFLIPVIIILVMAPLIAKSRGFAMREKDIHYKSGIIWHKKTSLPFNRIQHVELERGPLERFFKLTTLKVFTAGGGSADMKIPALTMDRAKNLRAFIIDKTGDETLEHDSNDNA